MRQQSAGLITLNEACQILAISRSTMLLRIKNIPGFPQPIKMGASKQAKVYFKHSDLMTHVDTLTNGGANHA